MSTNDNGRGGRDAARMQRKKDVVDGKSAAAATEHGALLVNTGNGKGESSAAFGVAAAGYLRDPAVNLVVLDELTYAFKYRWLPLDEVPAAFAARPSMQHIIVTGRAAPAALIEAADTVTDMTLVKHAFKAGVKAMPGIEW